MLPLQINWLQRDIYLILIYSYKKIISLQIKNIRQITAAQTTLRVNYPFIPVEKSRKQK